MYHQSSSIIIEHHQSMKIFLLINHRQSSSIIVNHPQASSVIINHHQSSLIFINTHQGSSILFSKKLVLFSGVSKFHCFGHYSKTERAVATWLASARRGRGDLHCGTLHEGEGQPTAEGWLKLTPSLPQT
jgi:hypothetical protein